MVDSFTLSLFKNIFDGLPVTANVVRDGSVLLWILQSNNIINWQLQVIRYRAGIRYALSVAVVDGISTNVITINDGIDDISTNRPVVIGGRKCGIFQKIIFWFQPSSQQYNSAICI